MARITSRNTATSTAAMMAAAAGARANAKSAAKTNKSTKTKTGSNKSSNQKVSYSPPAKNTGTKKNYTSGGSASSNTTAMLAKAAGEKAAAAANRTTTANKTTAAANKTAVVNKTTTVIKTGAVTKTSAAAQAATPKVTVTKSNTVPPVSQPVVAPKPTPAPQPVAVPKPTPAPQPVAVPKPTPVSQPVAVPKPTPVSQPVVVPKSTVTPTPVVISQPKVTPAPAPQPTAPKPTNTTAMLSQAAGEKAAAAQTCAEPQSPPVASSLPITSPQPVTTMSTPIQEAKNTATTLVRDIHKAAETVKKDLTETAEKIKTTVVKVAEDVDKAVTILSPIVKEVCENIDLKKAAKEALTNTLDAAQLTLDLAGFVPGIGEIPDGINAGIYTLRGDWPNAALSATACVPFAGWGATGGKLINKGTKAWNGVTDTFSTGKKLLNQVQGTDWNKIYQLLNQAGEGTDSVRTIEQIWKAMDQSEDMTALLKTLDRSETATDLAKTADKTQAVTQTAQKTSIPKAPDSASSQGVSELEEAIKGGLDTSIKNIDEFIGGGKSFDDVLDDYAKVYADKINSNQAWSWDDTIPGGENLTKKQRSIIKQQAIDDGLIPDIKITKVEGMRYGFADFESAGVVKETQLLPENMWKMSDAEQFKWLDEQIGGTIEGYTWHHTEIPGKMQLVPTGIHNITTHNGGRTAGMWADAPR